MSLVGNLEDLSLGDIMQIISLSQKSGVLVLKGKEGSGRIVFQDGLVHAASVNEGPPGLRELLVDGGPSPGQIDAQLRAAVEAAVLEMFSWPSGDFSFDVRGEAEADDPPLLLASGLNAQYLAMEGMRVLDERSRDEANPAVTPPETDSTPFDSDPIASASLEPGVPEVQAIAIEEEPTAADVLVASVVSRADGEVRPEPAPPAASNRMVPAVLIDPDVSVLDWVKTAIKGEFARIHVFQQADQGLARIRQYLIRGELPVVVISTEISIDPLSGIHGLSDFVQRLKTQAEQLVVVGLRKQTSSGGASSPGAFDGVLLRPEGPGLRESEGGLPSEAAQALVASLGQILRERNSKRTHVVAETAKPKSASVRDLRDATEKLHDASSRGEVLPVVLDFAAEIFARVAILIVREDEVFAIAGRGIAALEVDPLDSKPPVALQALENGWVRSVLQSGKPVQAPASTPADHALLRRLGAERPDEAYLGPIESGGSTIALLYGDQGTAGAGMPDTSGLEVVLHHAALALDRAALERALWEVDAGRSEGPQGGGTRR